MDAALDGRARLRRGLREQLTGAQLDAEEAQEFALRGRTANLRPGAMGRISKGLEIHVSGEVSAPRCLQHGMIAMLPNCLQRLPAGALGMAIVDDQRGAAVGDETLC